MNFFEANLLYNMISQIQNDIFDRFFVLISFLFDNGYLPIIVALILLCFPKHRKTGLRILIALLIGLVIGNIILKPVIARIRPFNILDINLIIPYPHDFSFPSGHSQAAFAFATSIFIYNKKIGIYAYILAATVAFSRLYLLVHYPTDIIAGMVLGVTWGYVSDFIIKHLKYPGKKTPLS